MEKTYLHLLFVRIKYGKNSIKGFFMNIGVIPARAGSKRFPGKNRAKFNSLELWKIAAQKSLNTMDRTIVNTDDPEIQPGNLCERYERPPHLTDGMSYRIDDVLIEMTKTLKFEHDDIICLFQPTSLFISYNTIHKIIRAFKDHNAESVQALCKVSNTHHAFSQRVFEDGWVKFAFPHFRNRCYNSQRKPDHYVFAGFVACRVNSLFFNNEIWGWRSVGIEVPEIESFDIDTKEDLEYAQSVLTAGFAV